MDKRCTRCKEVKLIEQFALCRGKPRARCKPCHSQDAMDWTTNNPERYKKRLKAWRRKNKQPRFMGPPLPDHVRRARKAVGTAIWRAENTARFDVMRKTWAAANPHKLMATVRRRQARILHAYPVWANEFFIEEIYDLSRRRTELTGVPHEVDHIIPLQGRTVCGLHVETNLRVIPRRVNRMKHNHYDDGVSSAAGGLSSPSL